MIRCGPPADYVSFLHLPGPGVVLMLTPPLLLPSYIAVMKRFGKYIRTAGTCELNGIRHYTDYRQASLTTMEISARMESRMGDGR